METYPYSSEFDKVLSEMGTAFKRVIEPRLTNQIYRTSPLLYRIFRVAREGEYPGARIVDSVEGVSVVEPLLVEQIATPGQATCGAYNTGETAEFAPLSTSTDKIKGAQYVFKNYRLALAIDNRDLVLMSKAARFDVLAAKTREAVRNIQEAMANDLYANHADGTKYMVGLQAMVASTGTVGGIDKSTYSWWRGWTKDVGSAALDYPNLNYCYYRIKKYVDAQPPTIIVTTPEVLEKFEDQISTVKVAADGGTIVRLLLAATEGGKRRVLDGGFEAFYFKGIPMVADPYCPSGKAFMIDERRLRWRVLQAWKSTGFTNLHNITGSDVSRLVATTRGALTTNACRKIAMLYNIAEAS